MTEAGDAVSGDEDGRRAEVWLMAEAATLSAVMRMGGALSMVDG